MEKSVLGLKPGSVIQDTYRVTELLGEGGMGATFSGVNMATGHDVAIKVITPEFARNQQSAQLFRREANLLRTVQSDAVVRFETTMMDKSGQLYLVMEYIKGKPLSHFLDKGARLASRDVLKLGARLAGGLAAIHRLGIVHRDVSPDNVIVPDDDILGAKLIDFGVASDTVGTDKSIIGSSFAGKISYASPEQLGLHGGEVGPASDTYALGLMLMKTAGLKVPGAGGSLADAIDARRNSLVPEGSRLSPALAGLLADMLRSDPKDRPEDLPAAFAAALAREDAQTDTPPPTSLGVAPRGKYADMAKAPVQDGQDGQDGDTNGKPKSALPLVLSGLAAAVLAGGAAWYFLVGPGTPATGRAMDQAAIAQEAVAADDPLSEITALVRTGGADNLNAAFGALMALARDAEQPEDLRRRAALAIARMYDPDTHSTDSSPFPAPNPSAARRFYEQARDLGADGVQDAIDRLSQ